MPGYVDAHHHFWDTAMLRYDWLADAPGLEDRYTLDEYRAATVDDPPDAYLFVQAGTLDVDGGNEARWVHGMCGRDPAFAGIVAWAPVEDGADAVARQLDELGGDGVDSLRGVRRLIQSEPVGWCVEPSFVAGVQELGRRGLVFDVCIFPRHLDDAAALARAAPDTRVVIDHLAKPDIAGGGMDEWLPGFQALAGLDNVSCKLSGLVTEADPERWQVHDLRPYVERALDAFGPDRLLWGSDWPVVTLAASHRRWREATADLLAGLSESERSAIRSRTAAEVYGFEPGGREG